ncbi:Possible FlgD protein [Sagittula stellata E-37]|uniref:Basal-body rod modification protein FlgD n=2 Tax=Sagittula stellata TaxID=52603 RepID=A3K323_SAGS3|nr:Possible FlgD protein [Sagittula stellata E-37]
MLTVQVQNQDPLNPVDSTEYATQLATFSSVEQQVQTNELLRNISATLGGNSLNEFGRWIGMEGLVRAPAMFDGVAPVTIRPDFSEDADRAVLVVRDAAGEEVQRFDIDVGEDAVVWGGHDSEGNALPVGVYRFDVESYIDKRFDGSTMARVYSRIDEVRNDNGTVLLRFADGSEATSEEIGGLRQARP